MAARNPKSTGNRHRPRPKRRCAYCSTRARKGLVFVSPLNSPKFQEVKGSTKPALRRWRVMAAVCAVSLLGAVLWLAWPSSSPGNPNQVGLRTWPHYSPKHTGDYLLFSITNAPPGSLRNLQVFIQEPNRWTLRPKEYSGVGLLTVSSAPGDNVAIVWLDSTNVPLRLVLECRERASSSFMRLVEDLTTQINGKLNGSSSPERFGRLHRVTNEFNLHPSGDSPPR